MKKLLMIPAVIAVMILAGVAAAQCPHTMGFWSTQDGTMLGGRVSEAWCDLATPGAGETGNTENAQSWDGADLGTQWKAWGMAIDAVGPTLIADNVIGGNGTRTWRTSYVGGQFWLSAANTWGDGVNDLYGDLTSYNVVATKTYIGGNLVGASANVDFTGNFPDCPAANGCEIRFAIANALFVWASGFPTGMPADYPPFLCDANAGELFDACCIVMEIYCVIGTEDSTWGAVKGLYR